MKPFSNLDQTFDITPIEEEHVELKKSIPTSIVIRDKEEDKERDYQHIRNEYYSLLQKGQTLIDGAMDVAEQSHHPRAYEVAGNNLKTVAEIMEKLMDLHRKFNEVTTEDTKISQTNVQNNVFVAGTTSEIMKLLKDVKNTEP